MLEVGTGLVTSPQNWLPSNRTQQGRFLQMGSLQTRGAGHTPGAERAGRAGENRLDHKPGPVHGHGSPGLRRPLLQARSTNRWFCTEQNPAAQGRILRAEPPPL